MALPLYDIQAWVHHGLVTDEVDDLFRLMGKELNTRDLKQAVALTQSWLRVPEAEREFDLTLLPRLRSLLRELAMLDPEPIPGNRRRCDIAVVLGGTIDKMRSRLDALVGQAVYCDNLVFLTSRRPVNEAERAELKAAGIERGGNTEADMAFFLLSRDRRPLCEEVSVLITPDPEPGKLPTTDDTIVHFAKAFGGQRLATGKPCIIFAGSRPSGLRQTMAIMRTLGPEINAHVEVLFTHGGLSKPLGELMADIFEEACRTLYEISLLPPDMLVAHS